MIQKALQYIVSLAENKTYTINGKTYSDHDLKRIEEPDFRRSGVEFGSLDAIVKMIRTEIDDYPLLIGALPLFIQVESHKRVKVFTRPDNKEKRIIPYEAVCRDTEFSEGWRDQQAAIIELRSRFIPTDDTAYLLDLISRINDEKGIQSNDNGVSQTVTVKQGVSLMATETIRPRISLKPFRTFREIPQPESEFLLRLDESGRVGLFEADGGIWKMEAKDNIMEYFKEFLDAEIHAGQVVVMV